MSECDKIAKELEVGPPYKEEDIKLLVASLRSVAHRAQVLASSMKSIKRAAESVLLSTKNPGESP